MGDVTALFWDVGGVLLSNGWDAAARRRAATEFELDWDEFQERHELVVTDFETGRLDLDAYLGRTVFHRKRSYRPADVADFMTAQSTQLPGTLEIVASLAETGDYLLATLNNESLELNDHRIATFGLRRFFSLFVSSCYVGLKKPDEAMYRLALRLTQRDAEHCVFIDDRPLNLECAARLGLRTIEFTNPTVLREELAAHGVQGS